MMVVRPRPVENLDGVTAACALELEHVTKRHPGGVVAIDDVSLSIRPGELVAVVGPSGSGKSTLLNLMGALDEPTSGRVTIGGAETAGMSDGAMSRLRAERLGFVFQQSFLDERLTAQENVGAGLLYAGIPRSRRPVLALEALARVGLAERASHRPHELSGGERQRVGIARALAGRPGILLADEPTGALDSATGGSIVDLFLDLHAEGATIVVITHDPGIAARLPRRVEVRDGRIVSDSTHDRGAA